MTCYTGHLDSVLQDLGMEKDTEGKKKLDLMIREKLNMREAHCPELWTKIKEITNNGAEMRNLTEMLRDTSGS